MEKDEVKVFIDQVWEKFSGDIADYVFQTIEKYPELQEGYEKLTGGDEADKSAVNSLISAAIKQYCGGKLDTEDVASAGLSAASKLMGGFFGKD